MAAQYIDVDYMRDRFGDSLVVALTSNLGTDLTAVIESATAVVQAALRSRGYAAGATTTDEAVKLATFAATWELLATMPKASLKLPDNWQQHVAKELLEKLKDPDEVFELATAPSTSRSAGASQWTDRSSTSLDPARTTRDELAGY